MDPSARFLANDAIVRAWGDEPDVDWDAVITLAELSDLAYRDAPTRRRVLNEIGFDGVRLLDTATKSGFIATAGDVAVVAFRGTDDPVDWIANGDFRQLVDLGGRRKLHAGFRRAYDRFAEQVVATLTEQKPERVWVTGHSLGGAMAACCAYDLLQRGLPLTGVVTFGQPRVGNQALAVYLDRELGDRYLRLMNNGDPVPILPPGFGRLLPAYWHSGRRAWLVGDRIEANQGPTVFAEPAPGAAGADAEAYDLEEEEGEDSFLSISEADFLELQEQLQAMEGPAAPPATFSADPGSPGKQAALGSSAFGGVAGFFLDRVSEHYMDAYLEQVNAVRRRLRGD